jgi:hypothetical protein
MSGNMEPSAEEAFRRTEIIALRIQNKYQKTRITNLENSL